MAATERSNTRGKAGASTRKMQASRMVVALVILLAIVFGTYLYSRNVKSIISLGIPGVVVAVLFVFGLRMLEAKGKKTIKRAKQAERGAIAEEKMGSMLEGMSEGHFVVHDFDTGKGNIDHVLIGPKGIFTIEVKSHRGKVTSDGVTLLHGGKSFEKDFIKQAWAECFAVREILAKWGIDNPKAEPLVVFTNAFVTMQGKVKGVGVMNLKSLPKFLEHLPDRLSTGEAGRIFNRLRGAA